MARPDYKQVLNGIGLFATLAPFDPRVAGTVPLGITRPDSDIDILCHAPDPLVFARALWTGFSNRPGFGMRQWIGTDRPVIATFQAEGWTVEIFGHALAVTAQPGWRHFEVERRLLLLGGEAMRVAVMAARIAGDKTEPAFARLLGLAGDPYAALLALSDESDRLLMDRLRRAGIT